MGGYFFCKILEIVFIRQRYGIIVEIIIKKYSSDLTDKQWKEIKPLLVGMRNRKWSKRDLIDAVFYLVDSWCRSKIGIWVATFAFFIYSAIKKFCVDGGYFKLLEK